MNHAAMVGQHHKSRRALLRPCTWVWLVLVALTLAAALLGALNPTAPWVVFVLLVMTVVKGQLIADYFMGLRRVRALWRSIILGYLLLVATGIGVAYRISLA